MYQGSCLCESVNFEIKSELKAIVNCHCGFCRKAHGSAFTTVLFVPLANLEIVAGAEFIERFPVPRAGSERCFCRRCGSRLFNQSTSANMASVVVAALTLNEPIRPVAHFNTESKCSWFDIHDGLPQFAATPEPAEFRKLIAG